MSGWALTLEIQPPKKCKKKGKGKPHGKKVAAAKKKGCVRK